MHRARGSAEGGAGARAGRQLRARANRAAVLPAAADEGRTGAGARHAAHVARLLPRLHLRLRLPLLRLQRGGR